MGQNVPDEQLLRIEMDRGNEPVLAPANIEHVKSFPAGVHIVNALERLFQFREILETASTRGLEPRLQGGYGVTVNLPELDQRLPRDYVHRTKAISIRDTCQLNMRWPCRRASTRATARPRAHHFEADRHPSAGCRDRRESGKGHRVNYRC